MGSQPKFLRDTVAEQIRTLRKARGMSQQALADRLNTYEHAAHFDRTAVAKIETGDRALKFEEAFTFALALDVAPVHLLVPTDSDEPIQLAPNFSASPYETRMWIRGAMPLLQDARVYFSTVPKTEFKAAEKALAAWQQTSPIHVTTEPAGES
jgi:transcriptional regulator with XRE-family HTH domain